MAEWFHRRPTDRRQTGKELASRQLDHSSSQVTRDHYIAKPPVSADLSELLERLAESEDASSDS